MSGLAALKYCFSHKSLGIDIFAIVLFASLHFCISDAVSVRKQLSNDIDEPVSYEGWRVDSIRPETESQLRYVRHLADSSSAVQDGKGASVKFWMEPTALNKSIQVLLSPDFKDLIEEHFSGMGLKPKMLIENLQKLIDAERTPKVDPDELLPSWSEFNVSSYHSAIAMNRFLEAVSEQKPDLVKLFHIGESTENRELKVVKMNRFLEALASQRQDLVRLLYIGKSTEKRDLRVVKIGSVSGRPKRAMWIDAGVHAREWIAPATALYIIYTLVAGYKDNAEVKKVLDTIDIYVLPLANPDGYEYSRSHDRIWRKTRSKTQCSFWTCCNGVDLNRNYGYKWGTTGTSRNPCNDVYSGQKPFSEPESRAIRDFVLRHNSTIDAFLTLHAFSQMWLIPFGDGSGPSLMPADYADLAELARKGAAAIKTVHGSVYKVGNAAELLYPASGSADDWAKGSARIKYAYTLELRPSDDEAEGLKGFILEPQFIVPTGEEVFAGMLTVANQVIEDQKQRK